VPERHNVLGDHLVEREKRTIRRRGTPSLHLMTAPNETLDVTVKRALSAAGRQVVPDGDPHSPTQSSSSAIA
jgi:hypothetical protein